MKQFLFYFFGMLSLAYSGQAQVDMNKDSLLKKLTTAREDSNKVKLYYALSSQYFKEDLKEAEKYCLQGGALSRKLQYAQGILDYYTNYSNILRFQGHFDSSLTIDIQAMEYAKKLADSIDLGRTMLNVGISYRQLEDYENAISYVEGAKDIFIRRDFHQYDGNIFNLLQNLYFAMHQYRKATNHGLQAIAIIEPTGNKSLLMETYNNLGLNYIELHGYDSALYYLNKAAVLAYETGEIVIQITTQLNYALIALRQQQFDSIRVYADKALAIARHYHADEYQGWAQYGLAYYHLQKKEYASAGLLADSALLLARQFNMRSLQQKLYTLLSNLHYATQNTQQGYHYFNQYELLNDSFLNESITNSTIHIEKKFETERKEAQIQLQQVQLRQQTTLNYFLTGGAAALLIILLLTYRNHRNRQKLQQVKIDELETEKQLTATAAVLKGEEQERTRLAKDLHDGLGGMLSGIKYSLNSMKGNVIMTAENAQAFERNIDMLDSSINEMRRVAHNVMPEILVKYGLDAALKEFCREIDRSGVIRVSYQSMGLNDVHFEQTTAITIYRIVQELVNNAIKHAAAGNVLVQTHVSEQGKLMAITVEDDGKGFDTTRTKASKGIGWDNIQNRVDFLKGKIDVHSEQGKGTSVLIEINL